MDVLAEHQRLLRDAFAKGTGRRSTRKEMLSIGERTVKSHVASAKNKLGADNRAHAAVATIQRGLLWWLRRSPAPKWAARSARLATMLARIWTYLAGWVHGIWTFRNARREKTTVLRRVVTAVLVASVLWTLAMGVARAQQPLTCGGYAYFNKNVEQCVIRHEREGPR